MAKILTFNARGVSSIPGGEAKSPHDLWPKNRSNVRL